MKLVAFERRDNRQDIWVNPANVISVEDEGTNAAALVFLNGMRYQVTGHAADVAVLLSAKMP